VFNYKWRWVNALEVDLKKEGDSSTRKPFLFVVKERIKR